MSVQVLSQIRIATTTFYTVQGWDGRPYGVQLTDTQLNSTNLPLDQLLEQAVQQSPAIPSVAKQKKGKND